jgi:hypothetical protein
MLRLAGLPPGYYENGAEEEGIDVLARPGAVVTVAEPSEGAEVEEQLPRAVYPVHPSRISSKVNGRRGSARRLMSSTESMV